MEQNRMEKKRTKDDKRRIKNFRRRKSSKKAASPEAETEDVIVDIEEVINEEEEAIEQVEVEAEPEEEVNEEAFKQEMIQTIVEETGFDEEEVIHEYDKFSAKYPDLEVSREVFMEANKEFVLAENLFNVFDVNNSNSLNFYEFMQIKKAMELTEIEEKMEWVFKIFDIDGQGYIDVLELKDVIEGVFKMVGKKIHEDEVMDCVAEIRYAIDDDRDWKITKDEFVTNGLKSKFIFNLLQEQNDKSVKA